jgi:hypothetical protein
LKLVLGILGLARAPLPAALVRRGNGRSPHPLGTRTVRRSPTIAVHHGRVVKRTGDGSIIKFRSVVDTVRRAIEVQNGMVERNTGLPPERRIEFRVGPSRLIEHTFAYAVNSPRCVPRKK